MIRNLLAPLLPASLSLVMLAGCATGSQLPITPRTVSGKALKIWTVHAEDRGDSIVVSGMVRRPQLAVGPVPGHLHIVATFADGRPDLIADTRWSAIPVRGSRTAPYRVRLPIADEESVSNIIVSYAAQADLVDTTSGRNP